MVRDGLFKVSDGFFKSVYKHQDRSLSAAPFSRLDTGFEVHGHGTVPGGKSVHASRSLSKRRLFLDLTLGSRCAGSAAAVAGGQECTCNKISL